MPRTFTDRSGLKWDVTIEPGAGPRITFTRGTVSRSTAYTTPIPLTDLPDEQLARFFGSTLPSVMIEKFRTYVRGKHRFFDEVVTFFSAFASLMLALRAHAEGSTEAYGTHQGIGIQGNQVTGVALTLLPRPLIQAIVENRWPDRIDLVETPTTYLPPKDATAIDSPRKIATLIAESAFVRYYETLVPTVKAVFGKDVEQWPAIWNFGRVVRNAFVHGGQIRFDNPAARSVFWRSLTYGPTDNGRQILFQDLSAVEFIILMEELDTAA